MLPHNLSKYDANIKLTCLQFLKLFNATYKTTSLQFILLSIIAMSDLTGIFIAQSPKQLLLTIALSAMARRSFRTCSKTTPRFEHLYGTCNNAVKSNITIGTHVC